MGYFRPYSVVVSAHLIVNQGVGVQFSVWPLTLEVFMDGIEYSVEQELTDYLVKELLAEIDNITITKLSQGWSIEDIWK